MQTPTTSRDEVAGAAAQVLAVDLDDLTLERVRSAVSGTEFAIGVTSSREAVERAGESEVPAILLVEASEGLDDEPARFFQALRSATRPSRCYVLALGGVAEQSTMSGSAHAVLRRPFGNEGLLLHLRHALLAMAASREPAALPREALAEALSSPEGGEVVLRSGGIVASIHVQGGHIVWAHLSSVPATIEEVARGAAVSLEPDVIAAVKQECRATGAHFMEVLVSWGLIAEDRAREAVRSFVNERVKLILDLPSAVALFLPKVRSQSARLRFRASEIPSLPAPAVVAPRPTFVDGTDPPTSRRPPPLPLDRIAGIVNEAMAVDGTLGAAVLERTTGTFLFHAGTGIDTEVAWSLVSALARLGAGAEEVMAAAGEQWFMARPLRRAPSLVLFMTLSSPNISLGLARAMMARIAATGGDTPPAPLSLTQ